MNNYLDPLKAFVENKKIQAHNGDCCICTDDEIKYVKSLLPKPALNILWEEYLNSYFKSTDRLGEMIDFVRYGDFPENGKSRCRYALAEPYPSRPELAGISVFEIVDGKEIYPMGGYEELFARPRYTGRGKIVGWGPDGEPLIELVEKE